MFTGYTKLESLNFWPILTSSDLFKSQLGFKIVGDSINLPQISQQGRFSISKRHKIKLDFKIFVEL